jgi:class 3 adenylate cyclase/tetratricopeptide (TPR) repeat protein
LPVPRGGGLPACPSCGEGDLPERSLYCLSCGARLGAEPAPSDSYTPDHLRRDVLVLHDSIAGERKEVTVVIADVAGSLALAASLDPEDVHVLMDGFFALALEAVHRQGGTVNQFRGDGFMALFGAPRARGDDAVRALRAALEVRERSRAYAETVRTRFGLPFAVRIGVSTGLVWVGAIGNEIRRDYTAEGPTAGRAARLEAEATPGQILVAEGTARRCRASFDFADRGLRRLRGLAEPERVFELVGEGPHRGRIAVERERGLTVFVGREAELARLRNALEGGEGLRCLEVCGEVGAGKSRLVHELVRRLPAAVAVLELSCQEAGVGQAYRPWLELLRQWPECLPGGEEAGSLVARLEGRGGASPEPVEVANRTHALLGAILRERPALLAIDDAQWLDPSSQRLVRRLTESSPEGSLGVLATLRAGEAADWRACPPTERIVLAPLSPDESRRLAGAVLAGLGGAAELAELALVRGGGNPLFVEEVARALRDGTDTARDAARVEMRLRAAGERVPETLHAVVAARIDALPESGKRLLEVAAVLGEPFDLELLVEVEPRLGDAPRALLAEVGQRGLVGPSSAHRYDFCHGVVRSCAYEQLVRERRRALHHRIAQVLAKRTLAETPQGASSIGRHFDRAGEPQQAAGYLLRAGRGYSDLRAFAEASLHLRRALELCRELAVRDASLEADAGLSLAAALMALDRTGEAAAVLEGLELDGGKDGDRLRLALAQIQAGWLRFSNENDVARGRTLVERGLSLAENLERADDVRLIGQSFLSRILLLDGDLPRALAATRRLIELAMARGDATSLVAGYLNQSAAHADAGRLDEARQAAMEALRTARSAESDMVLGTAQVALARVHLQAGDLEAAFAAAALASEAGERSGQVALRYGALVVCGYAHLLADHPRAAHEAFESLGALNDRWPTTWLHRARGRLELGEAEAAAELAARCLALEPPAVVRARALAVRGLALGLGGGAGDEAEPLLSQALELCGRLGLLPHLAETQEFLAELCERRGEAARAEHYARRAREEYLRCGMALHARRVRGLSGAAS